LKENLPAIVAPCARLLRGGEQLSDVIQQAPYTSPRFDRGRAADRLLVDHDEPLDPVEALR